MKPVALTNTLLMESSIKNNYLTYLSVFFAGLLGPLGFAPFHMPGITIISLALLFSVALNCTRKQGLMLGFLFGLGYFGFGVSWVIVSIHDYGELNYLLAGITTLAFIAYLALFPALVMWLYKILEQPRYKLLTLLLFSTLWCFSEIIRASIFSGFPWLIAGTTQIDTPLKYLAPIIGLHGLSFLCVFLACLLAVGIREQSIRRFYYLSSFVLILIIPAAGKYIQWTQVKNDPVSIGVIQANLSMRDKWDENLFWKLLKYYEQTTEQLLGKQLIILPESAIPLPASYLEDYLDRLHEKALKAKSALILGILQPTDTNETHYHNSIISLGTARGVHVKNHLVPFGEYIPKPFVAINRWMNLPEPNILPGRPHQPLINVANHPIASLICYEIAYPNIVRLQMPMAQWIISISDNGWFGRSLASYQQLQMAQMLSLLTGRYQVVVNNDGLSSVINHQGEVLDSLPPFSSGILQSEIFPAVGSTPWIHWNEYPVFFLCSLILIFALILQVRRLTKQ
ncbi:apolipoprotein N-acyltransferase [Legionella moravica]|uniref:Apolipoprotein N-acyltransferase n=1 Tax=Legionella moravica TaxID=39962 RepID=A0A378K122_9GAMM|nr:apolipoprotein N-acyltransferase [Legionella moravica]KTD34165.1 apolipoprotein N-acyltransferase [Legionella moravica]STX62959.1 apolipoprotein N-acyltransferase [Legionella moravica]